MRNLRVIVPTLCSIIFGISALVVSAAPSHGIAQGTPPADKSPVAVETPSGGEPFLPDEPSSEDMTPLFEVVAAPSTPVADETPNLIGVMPLTLGPGQGYGPHQHLGASILLVTYGEVCIAQISLHLPAEGDDATVTVIRQKRATKLAADTCDGIKTACPDQLGGGCEFVPCRDTCTIARNQSFWLEAGDKVIQTNSTEHAMLNVGGPNQQVEMVNTVVIKEDLSSGCAGDCH